MPNAIESETLLLVEGNDHRNFFEAFRDHLAIPEMQIENYGGVSQPEDDCIDRFFECIESGGGTIRRPAKARTCAYLSTTNDPHVSVGVAAKKGVWDFKHDAFSNVREFLSRLGSP